MGTIEWVAIGIGVFFVLYFISIYNRLVGLKHNVAEAWSNIDVLLKQRYEELPKLVETCRQSAAFEEKVLTAVTALRNEAEAARQSGDVHALSRAESGLTAGLQGIFMRAEAYPDLKTNAAYQQLMGRISTIEDSLSDRREFYNEAVNINNTRREQFPDLIIARLFAFKGFSLFEVAEKERQDVDMKALFSGG